MEDLMGGSAARTWSVVLGLALGLSALLPAAPAAAHNSLTGSDPKDGARVATAPSRIELRFLATPARDTTKITVTGPDNASASTGVPTFSGKRVAVPFRPGPAGVYTVDYQVSSLDGHPVRGKLRFTLTTGAPAATRSATPMPTPTAASPATPTAAPASPAPGASRSDDGGSAWWWAVGAAALLALLCAALLLRRRRTHR
jgi:copper resistance protein C